MKLRIPALVVLPISMLLVAGCGGSSPSTQADESAAPTASTSASTPTGAAGSSASPAAGASGSAAQPSTGGGASAAPSAGASRSTSGQPSQATFTAPGTYTYDASGTVTAGTPRTVDGTAELTVDKPAGNSQHSALRSEQGGTEQDVLHLDTGTHLARLLLSIPGQTKEFRPAKPVLGHARPASIGRSWSWAMTSTDGKTKASYAAKFVRQETLTIGGVKVATWVIDSTLKLTGDVTYTDRGTTWYDEARLLRVKTRSQGSGSFSGIAFTTDVTNTLRSVRPS